MRSILVFDDLYRDIPVIMMSATGRNAIPADLRSWIHGFLQKPFTFDELMTVLSALPLPK